MANFNLWIDTPGKRRYNRVYNSPLYSDDPNDSGNYNSAGQLVGTMRSISAPAWESYTGRTPSAADMQSITIEQAKQFYKTKVWDAVNGDSIKSQVLAEMLADMKSSAGGNGVKQLQIVLGVQADGSAGAQTVEALNNAIKTKGAPEIYESYRQKMIEYYQNIGGYFLSGWIRDMDKYYPQRAANDPIFNDTAAGVFSFNRIVQPQNIAADGFLSLAVFLAVFFIIRRKFFLALLVAPFLPPV